MAVKKFRWLRGKLNTVLNGGPVQFLPGDLFTCEEAGMVNFVRDGNAEPYAEPEIKAVTAIAYRRPDGLFDVVNAISQVAITEKPATEEEAKELTQTFVLEYGWKGLDYVAQGEGEEGNAPYYLKKRQGIQNGKPSFEVIERATGKPVNPDLVGKPKAEALLKEFLDKAAAEAEAKAKANAGNGSTPGAQG